MTNNAASLSSKFFPVYAIVSVTAIFYLPYFFPSPPAASSSYLFGYNNKIGIALLLALTAVGVILTSGLRLNFPDASNSRPVSRKVFFFSLIAVLIGCASMYMLAGALGGFGESSYEIDRIWLTFIGKRPYIDFEWPFGASLLYVPVTLCRLFSLKISTAYYLFWGLSCLVGVWLLYAVISAIDYPSQRKTRIYALLFFAWFPQILNMGAHYALVRYLFPIYGILIIDARLRRHGTRSLLLGILLVILLTTAMLFYSPEIAIAVSLTSIALFFILPSKKNKYFWPSFGLLIVLLLMLFGIASMFHILDTVKASGSGADSFPIIPSPHILLFFAGFFLCMCYAYQQLTKQEIKSNFFGITIFAIPMLAAALGRCDPDHVLLNGFSIFLFSLFFASNHDRFWKHTQTAFLVFLIIVPTLGEFWLYAPLLAKTGIRTLATGKGNTYLNRTLISTGNAYINHFAPPNSKKRWQEHLQSLLHGTDSHSSDLSSIYPGWHGGYLAPFGYRPDGIGTSLTTQIDYGRYEGIENANTLAAIDMKIEEMRNNPDKALLLADHYTSICEFDVRAERQEIEILFASPYLKAPAHPQSVRYPICAYIEGHYNLYAKPSTNNIYYDLWVAKNISARSQSEGARIK
jgi:hypothetical protein